MNEIIVLHSPNCVCALRCGRACERACEGVRVRVLCVCVCALPAMFKMTSAQGLALLIIRQDTTQYEKSGQAKGSLNMGSPRFCLKPQLGSILIFD